MCSRPIQEYRLLRNQIVTLLFAGMALFALRFAVAAPPNPAGARKKSEPDEAASTAEAGDTSSSATDKTSEARGDADDDAKPKKVRKTDSEWMKILSREQFRVTRKKGGERPFTGKLWSY